MLISPAAIWCLDLAGEHVTPSLGVLKMTEQNLLVRIIPTFGRNLGYAAAGT